MKNNSHSNTLTQHLIQLNNRQLNAGAEREHWPVVAHVWSIDGSTYCGCIKYHAGRQLLSAWCLWRRPGQRDTELEHRDWGSHGICRLVRTCRTDCAQLWRGRPVSLLVSWLHRGCGCNDRQGHLLASKKVPASTRLRVRDWMESKGAEFSDVLALERPHGPDEPREHERSA